MVVSQLVFLDKMDHIPCQCIMCLAPQIASYTIISIAAGILARIGLITLYFLCQTYIVYSKYILYFLAGYHNN